MLPIDFSPWITLLKEIKDVPWNCGMKFYHKGQSSLYEGFNAAIWYFSILLYADMQSCSFAVCTLLYGEVLICSLAVLQSVQYSAVMVKCEFDNWHNDNCKIFNWTVNK